MGRISELKQEIMHRAWAEQVKEYQESGMSKKEWCKVSGKYSAYRKSSVYRVK